MTPPVISNVVVDPGETTATITFVTDEPADDLVNYGLTAGYGSQSSQSSLLVTQHSISLTGLQSSFAGILHHFQIVTKDASNNEETYEGTFTTDALAPPPRSPMSTLSDPFSTAGVPNSTLWTTVAEPGVYTQVRNGRLEIKPPASLARTGKIVSKTTWDFTNESFLVKMARLHYPITGAAASTTFVRFLHNNGDRLEFAWASLANVFSMVCRKTIGGVMTQLYNKQANGAGQRQDLRWWKIIHSGADSVSGTLTWQYGRTPATLLTATTTIPVPFDLGSLQVEMGLTTNAYISPGQVFIDSLNSVTEGVTLGALTLDPLINAIGYECLFTGDDNQALRANFPTVRYKRTVDGTWRTARPAYPAYYDNHNESAAAQVVDAGTSGIYGSIINLLPNTSYDVELTVPGDTPQVVSATATTRAEPNVDFWPGGVAIAADYYVDWLTGSDSNNGTTTGTPFKTLSKAITTASAGDSIRVDSQFTPAQPALQTKRLTIFAKTPGLQRNAASGRVMEINSGTRCVIEPSSGGLTPSLYVTAPVGAVDADVPAGQIGPWTAVALTGPVAGGTWTAYRMTPPVGWSAIVGSQMFGTWGTSRAATPKRLVVWSSMISNTSATYGNRGHPNLFPATAAQWVERLKLNATCTTVGGVFCDMVNIWVVMPDDAPTDDPNEYWFTFSERDIGNGRLFAYGAGSDDSILAGFQLRNGYAGVLVDQGADRLTLHRNHFILGQTGVWAQGSIQNAKAEPAIPETLVEDLIVQDSRFDDSYLWGDTVPSISWQGVKVSIIQPVSLRTIPPLSTDNVAGGNTTALRWGISMLKGNESGSLYQAGSRRCVFRRNHTEGPYNGSSAYSEGTTRYVNCFNHTYENVFVNMPDDAIEPEPAGLVQIVNNNKMHRCHTLLSMGPASWGGDTYVLCEGWQTGMDKTRKEENGIEPRPDSYSRPNGTMLKFSASEYPTPHIDLVGNTWWTNANGGNPVGPDGAVNNAGGNEASNYGSRNVGSAYFVRNMIVRAGRYPWQIGSYWHLFQWDSDYGYYVTSNASFGMSVCLGGSAQTSSNRTTVAQYKTNMLSTGQDQNSYPGVGTAINDATYLDAQFIDPAGGILILKPGSPLLNAGIAVPNAIETQDVDFWGSAPDIGCWQMIVGDSFTRADSASSLGSTDAKQALAWDTDAGAAGIAGNLAYFSALSGGQGRSVVVAGFADLVATVTVSGSAAAGLILRSNNGSTSYLVYRYDDGGLYKVVAGTPTLLLDGAEPTLGSPILVTFKGADYSVWQNEIWLLEGTLSDADQATFGALTRVGLYAESTASRFADFAAVKTLV